MRLSVVMAVYNGERHLPASLDSVLAQSFADFELLVVDDASTDGTAAVLESYARRDARLRILRNERNLGPYPSLNRALDAASGEIVARQDADDVSPADRFAVQMAAFDADADVLLVTGHVDMFDADDRRIVQIRPPSWQPRLEWELLFGNVIGAGGHVMFARRVREVPVLYSTGHRCAQDYDLWNRLARLGRVVCPARIIYKYRRHASSITTRRRSEQDAAAAAIRRAYRAQYLRSEQDPEAAEELSGFWAGDPVRWPGARRRPVGAQLAELRAGFLPYIEQRYGASDSRRLDAEWDEALTDRLGYWLYRSISRLRIRQCLDVMATAGTVRQAVYAAGRATGHGADALGRRLGRRAHPRSEPLNET